METPQVQPVKKTSGRKVSLNKGAKKKATTKKTAAKVEAKTKAKTKTVKKKTENGTVEVEVVPYNANLAYQFENNQRAMESHKAFKKDLKENNPEMVPAYKEHARRQKAVVVDGLRWWEKVIIGAIVGGAAAGTYAGVQEGRRQYRAYQENKALEVE